MAKLCCGSSSTSKKVRSAEFIISAPKAKKVAVAGTFNNWDIKNTLAKKDVKGTWKAKVDLTPGRYEYKFVVDGSWINDPRCNSSVGNNFGTQNSVLEIK